MSQKKTFPLKWSVEQSLSLSRILIIVMLVLCVGALPCIPIVTAWYDAVSGQNPIHIQLNIALYLSDGLYTAAMLALYKMLASITRKNIFVEENVRCLRGISWCCYGVAVIWGLVGFLRILALFLAFLAAFCGLILRVMKNLFAMAVQLREENDYTI